MKNMKKLLNYAKENLRRALLILPVVVLVFNSYYYKYKTNEITDAMLHEKLVSVTDAVDMLAAAVEGNTERAWSDHELNVRNSVEFLDDLYQVYGAAYKPDGNGKLTLITKRVFETSVFEPFDYPEFTEAVTSHNYGNIVIGYAPQGQDWRELHIYYRWTPLYAPPDERYLVVAGVSRYSIVTHIPLLESTDKWVNTAVIFGLAVLQTVMLQRGKRGEGIEDCGTDETITGSGDNASEESEEEENV